MKQRLSLLLLITGLFACGDNLDYAAEEAASAANDMAPAAMVATTPNANAQPTGISQPSHIIKTAHCKFQVEAVDTSTRHIERIVARYNGLVSAMDLNTSSTAIVNELTIRVPAAGFEPLLTALEKEARFVHYKKISTEDVSEEFVDIQTRLQAKREVRDRYVDILKNKAKTVEDVLRAEKEIHSIQEEIEAKEGRLRYLQNKVALSTIYLEIYQQVTFTETPVSYEKSFLTKAGQGLRNGWDIITGLTLVIINIWPLTIIGIVLVWKRKWLKNKLMQKEDNTRHGA